MVERGKSDVEIKNELDSSFEDEPTPSKSTKKIKIGQQGECVKCKRQVRIYVKSMCSACYQRARKTLPEYNVPNCCCIDCMAVAKVDKHGRCRKCSDSRRKKARKTDVSKYRECKECKQTKLIVGNGLCNTCYMRLRPKTKNKCQICDKVKILKNKTTCAVCYRKKLAETDIRMCKNCGKMRPHCADQMCRECYNKISRTDPSRKKECVRCGGTTLIAGRGMCQECYNKTKKDNLNRHKKCVKCNKIKFIEGHGLCKTCYSKGTYQQLKADKSKHKKCVECKKLKPILCREMCNACYHKIFVTPKRSAKRKLARQSKKSLLIPKIEVSSGDEDEDFGQEADPLNVKVEVSSGEEDEDFGQEDTPLNFKVEVSSEDEFDPNQPEPSWKY